MTTKVNIFRVIKLIFYQGKLFSNNVRLVSREKRVIRVITDI